MNFLSSFEKDLDFKKSITQEDIQSILKSIVNIEQLKKYITFIRKNISNIKIKKLHIFDSLTQIFFKCAKTGSINEFIYIYNNKYFSILSAKCKSFIYDDQVFKCGYVYFEKETVNVYYKNHSYIIKYSSIINVSINILEIFLNLKNEKTFKIELNCKDDKIYKKLKEKCKLDFCIGIEKANPSSGVFHNEKDEDVYTSKGLKSKENAILSLKKDEKCHFENLPVNIQNQKCEHSSTTLKKHLKNSPVSLKKNCFKSFDSFKILEDTEKFDQMKHKITDTVNIQGNKNDYIYENKIKDEYFLKYNKNRKCSIFKQKIYLLETNNYQKNDDPILFYNTNSTNNLSFNVNLTKKFFNNYNINNRKNKIFKYIRQLKSLFIKQNSHFSHTFKKQKKKKISFYKKTFKKIKYFFLKYKFILKKLKIKMRE